MDNVSLFFLVFGLNGQFWGIDNLMIFGAKYLIYLTILLVFVLGLKAGLREKKALLLIFLAIPIAILLIKAIHIFFYEPRPYVFFHFSPLIDNNADASFPSRHASIASVVAFSYLYFKSKWAPVFLFLLTWVGVSRVYVGVHYPLDIVGGIIVGVVSLIIAKQVVNLLKTRFFKG